MKKVNIKILLFALFAVLFIITLVLYKGGAFFSFSNSTDSKIVREGDRVPTVQFLGLNSEKLQLSKKITLIHFWATWCGPCAEELPSFDQLISQFSGQIQVFAISQDDSVNEIQAFMKPLKSLSTSQNFKIIPDFQHELGSRFKVLALPETYIVNQDGIVIRKIVGAMDWSSLEVQKYFKEMFSQK